jgi:CHAP domain
MAAAIGVAAPAEAASGTVSGTGGAGLTVRSTPSTSGSPLRVLPEGTNVYIDCQTNGTPITGPWGTTSLWDHLPAYGGYVSDAYVYTGTNGRVAPECSGGTPPPSGGIRDRVVSLTIAQVGNGPSKYTSTGDPWCQYFVNWIYTQAGERLGLDKSSGYSGAMFQSAQRLGVAHWGIAGIRPGDAIYYGDGPAWPSNWGGEIPSDHVGIVTKVYADGTIETVEGNVGNRVVRFGRFNPLTQSHVTDVNTGSVEYAYGYIDVGG